MSKREFKNRIELQLNADEILEFIDFLKVAENNGVRCASATRIKKQMHEFVLARIEGREPKPIIQDTEDFLMQVVDDRMVKMALHEDKFTASQTAHAIGEIMKVPATNSIQNIGNLVAENEAQVSCNDNEILKILDDSIKEASK